MIEHYNSNIQDTILRELFKASSSIKIAMAWFTNDLLFQPLLLKLQTGVDVSIIINHDDINFSDNNTIDFNRFVNLGGNLHLNESKTLMHDKFCIIDNAIVIAGTYNWTNKAEHNDESIMIIRSEPNFIDSYNKLFDSLSNKYLKLAQTQESNNAQKKSYQKDIFHTEPFCFMGITNGSYNIFEDAENSIIVSLRSSNNAKVPNLLTILDYHSFKPLLPYEYEDVCCANTKIGTIWLSKNGRWALYSVRNRKFLTHHAFTDIIPWPEESRDCLCNGMRVKHFGPSESYNVIKNHYKVKLIDKYGICNANGEIVVPCEYDNISESTCQTENNRKYGVILPNLSVIPPIYDAISLSGSPSRKENKYGLFSDGTHKDVNGKIIPLGHIVLDFVYDQIMYRNPIDPEIGYFYVLRQGKRYGFYLPSSGAVILSRVDYDLDSKSIRDIEYHIKSLYYIMVKKKPDELYKAWDDVDLDYFARLLLKK